MHRLEHSIAKWFAREIICSASWSTGAGGILLIVSKSQRQSRLCFSFSCKTVTCNFHKTTPAFHLFASFHWLNGLMPSSKKNRPGTEMDSSTYKGRPHSSCLVKKNHPFCSIRACGDSSTSLFLRFFLPYICLCHLFRLYCRICADWRNEKSKKKNKT